MRRMLVSQHRQRERACARGRALMRCCQLLGVPARQVMRRLPACARKVRGGNTDEAAAAAAAAAATGDKGRLRPPRGGAAG